MIIMNVSHVVRAAVVTVLGTVLPTTMTACGGSSGGGDGRPNVVVGAYPFEYAVQRVGGDLVKLTNLLAPGTDGHDLELTPQQTAAVGEADLVVYMAQYQAAFDEAVAQQHPNQALDVGDFLELRHATKEGDDERENEGSPGHDHGVVDPHVWLNPLNMAEMGRRIASKLGELDPGNADTYQANAAALASDLARVDTAYSDSLANCRTDTFVTSHAAFGYLAGRYGLTQVGISGLSTEEEPSPARIAAIHEIAIQHNLTTIFYETAVSPKVAETIASDLGLQTDILDPVETLGSESRGRNYLEVMESNRRSLAAANGCQ